MIVKISYYMILGQPVVVWLGVIAYAMLIIAAMVAFFAKRSKLGISFKWHPRLAIVAVILATLHAFLIIMCKL